MKRALNKTLYIIAYGFWYLVALLPFPVLYLLSDGLYLLMSRVVRYRHKVIWKNLKNSFPEKTDNELRLIERGFYHWFCDYIVETLKLMTMSKMQLMKRMTFTGTEEFDYVAAAKLGVLDKYKTILETGVIADVDKSWSSNSVLGKIVGNDKIVKLVNAELAELFPADVFEQSENSTYLKFNPKNADKIRKIDIITWLRTQPNFYRDDSTYGLTTKVNGATYHTKILF